MTTTASSPGRRDHQPRRGRVRPWAGAAVVLAVALASLGATPSQAEPPARATAIAKRLTVTPAQPMAGERTVFSGRASAARATLERKKGKAWVTVARGKVRKGKFKLAAKVKKAGTYRVRAGSTTRKVRVRLAPQAAQMSVGAPFVAGLTRQVTATISPVRAGRTVSLQRLTGGTWATVASGVTDGTGQARIAYAGGAIGGASYRVLGEAHRGSATVTSAAQPVRTAASPELVSPGTAALESSSEPTVSADGRWVAFSSDSPLLPTDTDGQEDVYLFDRVSGSLWHVLPEANNHVNSPLLSADGRFLAVQTLASNVSTVPDAGSDYDVFVLDRATGAVELISTQAGGTAGANDDSYLYGMSDDGRVIAFTSTATDLVASLPPADHTYRHAYVRTRGDVTRGLDRVGLGWSDNNIYGLDLSADGTRVAFSSTDTDLGPDVNGSAIFGWDIAADGTISGRTNLTPGIDADSPSLDRTGDVLAFTTDDALSVDLNGARDTYLRTAPGSFTFAGPYGAAGNPGGAISDDARFVTFGTKNVLPGDTNGGQADIVVWERATGTSTLVTRAGPGASGEGVLSGDNSVLVFGSAADVTPGATGAYDVFVQVLR
ncbi:MAG TPA: hypothetical protein VGE43_08590 [Acidimicrobiales bacterium]